MLGAEDRGLKVKAIIIDMDGTITNFNLDYLGARRRALEELERMNLRTREMTEQLSIYLILKQLRDHVAAETFIKLRTRLYKLFEEMEVKAAEDVTLYPGAMDTLRKLKGMLLKIGIVTNNSRAGTEITLKRCRLENFFDAIVTRDDCEEMKPDPGPVQQALQQMRVQADDAIFVGDGVMDVIAAKAAGLRSVSVPTGPFKSDRLLQAEPDYLIASINDLPTLIESLDDRPSN